jgi:hypothetical protein
MSLSPYYKKLEGPYALAREALADTFGDEIYPDRYRAHSDILSPEVASYMACTTMIMESATLREITEFDKGGDIKAGLVAANVWLQYGAQHYKLSKSLLRALSLTTPTSECDYLDMELPFPSLLVHLPEGAVVSPEGPVPFIMICVINSVDPPLLRTMSDPTPQELILPVKDQKAAKLLCTWAPTVHKDMPAYGATLPLDKPTVSKFLDGSLRAPFSLCHTEGEDGIVFEVQDIDQPEVKTDREFLESLERLALNFLFISNARPDLFPRKSPETVRKAKVKNGKTVKPALKEIRVYGDAYKSRIKGTVPEKAASSPAGSRAKRENKGRTVWVCGYPRIQHYGKGNSQTKSIWVEPYQKVV